MKLICGPLEHECHVRDPSNTSQTVEEYFLEEQLMITREDILG